MTRSPLPLLAFAALAGCSSGQAVSVGNSIDKPPHNALIEEPDLYRRDGNLLYVQNPATGLHIVDLTDPARPRHLGTAPVTNATGAELLLQPDGQVAILLKDAADPCLILPGLEARSGWKLGTELALVDARAPESPRAFNRYCIPGEFAAARTVDQILYVVTTNPTSITSRAAAIDLADPTHPRLIEATDFPGASRDIVLTATTLIVAAAEGSRTNVQYLSLDPTGALLRRGSLLLPGSPQGPTHMALAGDQLRIVTLEMTRGSRLSLIDTKDPDHLALIGDLDGIAPGETLYATQFDGDRAYIVTFRPQPTFNERCHSAWGCDPLWVVSLADPTKPKVLGELQIPGWSDYLFPRGDRLVAVGRSDGNRRVEVSLFDVADPENPTVIRQLELGAANSNSEANLDHRGVTLLDTFAPAPLLVVPYATVEFKTDDSARTLCTVRDNLQLLDLAGDDLIPRGTFLQRGTLRRSFPVADRLYSLSDYELASLDVSDRDRPQAATTLTLGTDESRAKDVRQTCDDTRARNFHGCSAAGRTGATSWVELALVLLALGLTRLRRTPRKIVAIALAASLTLGATSARADEAPAPCDPMLYNCSPGAVQMPVQIAPAPPVAVERQRNIGLGVAGLAIFGGLYLLNAAVGYIAGDWRPAIPVVGPLFSLARYHERFECGNPPAGSTYYCGTEGSGDRMVYAIFVMDALIQAGGLLMATAGFLTTKEVRVGRARVSLVPSVASLTAVGTF